MKVDAGRLARRIEELSRIGADGDAVSRLGLTAEEQAAREIVGGAGS